VGLSVAKLPHFFNRFLEDLAMAHIGFNTGRTYTANRQWISVGLAADNETVLFNDHDRMIYGALKTDDERLITQLKKKRPNFEIIATLVMHYYDTYQYQYHSEADKINAGNWPRSEMYPYR
jgi:hypothetical protein